MPELPEVEHMGRVLAALTEGRALCRFELLDPSLLKVGDPGPALGIGGPVRRRGKYLAWQTGRDGWILHFRMTGRIATGPGPARARWSFADGSAVAFVDPRRLGELWRVPAEALDARLAALPLGPEPWPQPRDGAWWAARFAGASGPLKPTLMDQARVAGLGNIAASEVCFRAALSPELPVQSLDLAAWARVAEAVPAYVNSALAALDGSTLHYVNEGGPNPFLVYARAGEPCPRCGATLVRLVQRGRSTFACRACQGLR